MKYLAEFSSETSNRPSMKALEPNFNISNLMPPKLLKPDEKKHKERYGEPKTSRTSSVWNNNIIPSDDQSNDLEEKALKNPISNAIISYYMNQTNEL